MKNTHYLRNHRVEFIPSGNKGKNWRTSRGRVYLTDDQGALHKVRHHQINLPPLLPIEPISVGGTAVWEIQADGLVFSTKHEKHVDQIRDAEANGWAVVVSYVRAKCRLWITELSIK